MHCYNVIKRSKAGFDPEFSFSETGYLTKAKELSTLHYYHF